MMRTEKLDRRSSHLATSGADELVYAIALAMARRQMRHKWQCRSLSGRRCKPALRPSNAVGARATF